MSGQEAFQHDTRPPRATRRRAGAPRGEVLLYRPRPADSEAPAQSRPRERVVMIRHGGREFAATPEMAQCFLANARRVIDAGDAQLVALLHADGLEMLFVADNIPFSVGTLFEHRPRFAPLP